MKYIIAIFVIASLGSCKKEYTCQCTSAVGFSQTFNYKIKKDDATKKCDAMNANYQSRPDSTTCQLE